MALMQVLDWAVDCDREATRRAHLAMEKGAAEACGCKYCRNFVAARGLAFTSRALELFAALGIQVGRESEMCAPIETEPGFQLYSGWFHFVGSILKSPPRAEQICEIPRGGDIGPGFLSRLTYRPFCEGVELLLAERRELCPQEFGAQPVVQLEFLVQVPWVIDEPPD